MTVFAICHPRESGDPHGNDHYATVPECNILLGRCFVFC